MTGHNDKEPRELVEDRQGRKGQRSMFCISIFSVFINLTIEDACSVRSNILQLVDHRVKRHFAGSLFVNDWHPGFYNNHHLLLKLKVNMLVITWHS